MNSELWVLLSKPKAKETKWRSPGAGLEPTQGFKEHRIHSNFEKLGDFTF